MSSWIWEAWNRPWNSAWNSAWHSSLQEMLAVSTYHMLGNQEWGTGRDSPSSCTQVHKAYHTFLSLSLKFSLAGELLFILENPAGFSILIHSLLLPFLLWGTICWVLASLVASSSGSHYLFVISQWEYRSVLVASIIATVSMALRRNC